MYEHLSIRKKLLVPGLVALLALVVCLSAFWASRYTKELNAAFDEGVQLSAEYSHKPLATAIWDYDDELAEVTLGGMQRFQPFEFARVFSVDDVFATSVKNGEWNAQWDASVEELLAQDVGVGRSMLDDLVLVSYPLELDNERVGTLIAGFSRADIISDINNTALLAAAIGLAAFAAFAGLLYAIAQSVSSPINDLVAKIDHLEKGNVSIEIPEAERLDEIGQLGRALESFRMSIMQSQDMETEREAAVNEQEKVVTTVASALHQLSGGDLRIHISEVFPDAYEPLRTDFNQAVSMLADVVGKISDSGSSIGQSSGAILNATISVTQRAEQSANVLEETSTSLKQLTDLVRSTSDGAQRVDSVVQKARSSASEGREVVSTTIEAMNEIEGSSNKISTIVDVIEDIAFQTNLLALNAGVEAARTGEAGKGFAVIASEVRELAQRSSAAAHEISNVINDSRLHVTKGVDLVAKTGESLGSISDAVENVASELSEIVVSAREQSLSIEEISSAVGEIDQATKRDAASLEETTADSEELKLQADALTDAIALFQLDNAIVSTPQLRVVNAG